MPTNNQVYQDLVRTPSDKIRNRGEQIELGGDVFTIRALSIRKLEEVENAAIDTVGALFGSIDELQDQHVLEIVRGLSGRKLLEVVKLFVPELATRDEDWILDNVASAELQDALWIALKINYPFVARLNPMQLVNLAKDGMDRRSLQRPSEDGH